MTNTNRANGASPYEVEQFFAGHDRGYTIERQENARVVDYLTAMYEKQTQLDERITRERGVDKTVSEWVIGITLAMESEIDEIRREVNWKWWKNEKEIDSDALQGEVIDMWHFLLSLSRVVGLTPADIHRLYAEKNAENHDRQSGASDKDGYAVKAAD